jgi:hypothetical protein
MVAVVRGLFQHGVESQRVESFAVHLLIVCSGRFVAPLAEAVVKHCRRASKLFKQVGPQQYSGSHKHAILQHRPQAC